MTVFSYKGAAVRFEEATDGKIYISTQKHGDLGEMWEEPNGSWSARANGTTERNIGNAFEVFKWIIERQQNV